MADPIYVNMLGRFTITEGTRPPMREISLTGRSKRLWTLIAYLILHRDRGVPAQELIDLLWPEADSDNPVSTLQNNVSRARSALGELGLTGAKSIIRYESGLYRWAPEGGTVTDYDEFENLVRQAMARETGDFLTPALRAVELYAGDFLPEASLEFWCINLNGYYRSVYLRLCSRVVQALMDIGRTVEAERICADAVRVDPTVEEFNILLMRAMIRNKNPKKALEHYEYIRQLYKDTYGVVPSPELEQEKAAAVRELYGQKMGEQELAALLHEPQEETGAFFCDNVVFREIVNLHAREMQRTKASVQIALLSLKAGGMPPEKQAVYMKQMERVLTACLRSGDPVTRMGSGWFAVLLPGAAPENGQPVMERVLSRFRREYPGSEAVFTYIVRDLGEIKAPPQ